MSVELTDAERAYLMGRDWQRGAEVLARALAGEEGRGVLVSELIGDKDGPEE